ncbi:MAG: ABC transporter permease [Deltaproteobacteria bacterium]
MADFRLPPLNAAERLYRALLHLYPPRFRRAFAQDLVETFRDQHRDAVRRGTPMGAFWFASLRDLTTQALAEWLAATWRLARNVHGNDQEESSMAAIPEALRFAELRFAVRRLARAPSFTIAAVFVLALGIGATTAVFSLVNGVLLRPLPYPSPDRLVWLGHSVQVAGADKADQSDASFLLYHERARAFDGIAISRDADVNLGSADGDAARAKRVASAGVSANLFDVLGVHPASGRGFVEGEDRPTAPKVAILSDALWKDNFHGDPSVIGKPIVVDGVSRQIVGVMPRGFAYPSPSTELWLPLALDPATANAGSFNYRGVARLKNGVTIDAARADLERVLPRILDEFPSEIPPAMWAEAHVRPLVTPLRDSIVGDVSRLLWILLGSVSLVLVIACANVANLFLVRGESRQLELAVRSALGSGLAGIIAQALSESFVLAASGGVIGVLLAAFGVKLATSFGGGLGVPRLQEVSVEGSVLAFALGVSVFCAVFVSLVPVMRARRVPIALVLREAGRGSTAGARRQWARSALVVSQVALALVLVAVSGLLARSFARLRDVKPGFEPRGIVMSRIALPIANYPAATQTFNVYTRLLDQVRAMPGVRDATLTNWVPLTNDHNDTVIGVEDHPLPPNAVPRVHFLPAVDAQYFHTMGIPLLAGRTFGPLDPQRPAFELVVSHAFAERYWPGASPLGKRVRPGITGPWWTIVGEVGDVHYDALDKPANDVVYLPLVSPGERTMNAEHFVALLVRTDRENAKLLPAIRQAVHAIDPALPTYDEHSLTEIVSAASARARVTLVLLAIASMLALILGAVGIYGVMAYGVSLRQREIGVRIALGARPLDVSRMVSRQGLTLGATGVVIGVVCALSVTRLLRGLLYDVSPTDPVVLGATCIVLLGVAFLASWIPARRAAAVDPSEALRA